MGFLTLVSILFLTAAKPRFFFKKRYPKVQVKEYISQVINSVENLMIYMCVRNNNFQSITTEERMKNTEVPEQLIKTIIKPKRMHINK